MLTPSEESYILHRAYVPEHIVKLMALVSKGEPFLIEDFVCYAGKNCLIFIAYPLEGNFSPDTFESLLYKLRERFRPEYIWFAAESTPASLSAACSYREIDCYYRLDLNTFEPSKRLQRIVEKASRKLDVERSRVLSREHSHLTEEWIRRERPGQRIEWLFRSMPEYVQGSHSAIVLNARSHDGKLIAFSVVELAARSFAAYVLGCHSKEHYVPHASDLLFMEMIKISREWRKEFINLGLGVNEGIRRFKEKWGGFPFLGYECCKLEMGLSKPSFLLERLQSKL